MNWREIMVTMYDPPSGWRYGFPKQIPEDLLPGDFKQWVLDSGYPTEDIDFALNYGRIWEEE